MFLLDLVNLSENILISLKLAFCQPDRHFDSMAGKWSSLLQSKTRLTHCRQLFRFRSWADIMIKYGDSLPWRFGILLIMMRNWERYAIKIWWWSNLRCCHSLSENRAINKIRHHTMIWMIMMNEKMKRDEWMKRWWEDN